jgi:phospholipid/cholesterol/gamma-HCH transport system permease protein
MSSLTLIIGTYDVVSCFLKAAIFGLVAGLIACFKGMTVGGGAQGVGNAVNETVVYSFAALYVINTLMAAFDAQSYV